MAVSSFFRWFITLWAMVAVVLLVFIMNIKPHAKLETMVVKIVKLG